MRVCAKRVCSWRRSPGSNCTTPLAPAAAGSIRWRNVNAPRTSERRPPFAEVEAKFLADYPEYRETRPLDDLRTREYSRLSAQDHIYLDYTGAGLYGESQLRRHFDLLQSHVFGNPHSRNPSSMAMTEVVERCRAKVLSFFNASPDEYVAAFTANASAALKLVGESYPFSPGNRYVLTFDNHNSVNGIREFARARGAPITYVPLELPELRVADAALEQALTPGYGLFAYPAQSNFSGVQHPLEWIHLAQAQDWCVLLDAAAFVPSNRLDLSRWRPDFVSLSFYKMFGYPTGIGCLLARHSALAKLRRPWFSGGTITVASVQGDRHFLAGGATAFEDGTPDYLGIAGVEIGLEFLQHAGIDRIHTRCRCLTAWLLRELAGLRHPNGRPAVLIYGPTDMKRRGGTITMNFLDSGGSVVDHLLVEESARQHNISLRSGCFCNPGAGESALHLSQGELSTCFSQPEVEASHRFTVEDFRRCVDGKSTGAVRVSLGLATNFGDVYRFVEFAREFAA
jgi:molybdenum cofactor sulfurtransferase